MPRKLIFNVIICFNCGVLGCTSEKYFSRKEILVKKNFKTNLANINDFSSSTSNVDVGTLKIVKFKIE